MGPKCLTQRGRLSLSTHEPKKRRKSSTLRNNFNENGIVLCATEFHYTLIFIVAYRGNEQIASRGLSKIPYSLTSSSEETHKLPNVIE
jgi:hypothetical protein